MHGTRGQVGRCSCDGGSNATATKVSFVAVPPFQTRPQGRLRTHRVNTSTNVFAGAAVVGWVETTCRNGCVVVSFGAPKLCERCPVNRYTVAFLLSYRDILGNWVLGCISCLGRFAGTRMTRTRHGQHINHILGMGPVTNSANFPTSQPTSWTGVTTMVSHARGAKYRRQAWTRSLARA